MKITKMSECFLKKNSRESSNSSKSKVITPMEQPPSITILHTIQIGLKSNPFRYISLETYLPPFSVYETSVKRKCGSSSVKERIARRFLECMCGYESYYVIRSERESLIFTGACCRKLIEASF